MKVAMATWNGRISPVFDVARQILLFDVDAGCVVARREEMLPGTDPQEQARCLAMLAPQTLICGAVSKPMADLLAVEKIRVIPFIAGDVDQVLRAWLSGTLPNSLMSMPGCCGRRRGCRGGVLETQNGRRWGKRKEQE